MALLVALLVMGATGCSNLKRVEVESNTCWEGEWDGTTVRGCGRQSFSTRDGFVCYVFKKTTRHGYLRVRVTRGLRETQTTDAAYGQITGCVP